MMSIGIARGPAVAQTSMGTVFDVMPDGPEVDQLSQAPRGRGSRRWSAEEIQAFAVFSCIGLFRGIRGRERSAQTHLIGEPVIDITV